MARQPQKPVHPKADLKEDFEELLNLVQQAPRHLQSQIIPLLKRLQYFVTLQARTTKDAIEVMENMQLDIAYLKFDADANQREKIYLWEKLKEYRDYYEEDD